MDPLNVIKSAVMSEKATQTLAKKQYILKVDPLATKTDIKKALLTVFGVEAVSVNTLIQRGKVVRRARSKKSQPISVKLDNVKKAFVTLKEGQHLQTVTNVDTKQD